MAWEQLLRFAGHFMMGGRSTALKSLLGIDLLLTTAVVVGGSRTVAEPSWLLAFLAAFLGLSLLTTLGAFIYFARRYPEMLRSEHYTLQKAALEHGIVGDSISGFLRVSAQNPGPPEELQRLRAHHDEHGQS